MLTFESLFENNSAALDLGWIGEPVAAGQRVLPDASGISVQAADLVGHLNLIHPKRIHVLGGAEVDYVDRIPPGRREQVLRELIQGSPLRLIVGEGRSLPTEL